jgi:nucleoside-diphosphate-sugar epimerase
MKRVLVTGATGCIGRHAVPALTARGWEVHAVSSRPVPTDFSNGDATWHRADLLDVRQMGEVVNRARPTHLLHLAWYVAPGKWATAPENFAWVQASLGLLQAFHDRGGTRVTTAGSCLEYDWDYGYCSESRTPRAPRTPYGVCKNALQDLTAAFAATSGLTSAWGRIFFVYGPHEHPSRLVASVIRSLLADEPARCSHGNQTRDYLFVQDVADALVTLLESDVTGPINIASGQAIALKEIVSRIGILVGKPELIRLGAIPPAPTDVPLVVADVERLHRLTTWRPRVDLDRGLLQTIDWWRVNMHQGEARHS